MESGKGKPYHNEMLEEMRQELAAKTSEYELLSANVQPIELSEEMIASLKYDIQTMINLLDAEAIDLKMLHHLSGKYISNLFIQRESKKMYLTIQFKFDDDVVLYEKTLVGDL